MRKFQVGALVRLRPDRIGVDKWFHSTQDFRRAVVLHYLSERSDLVEIRHEDGRTEEWNDDHLCHEDVVTLLGGLERIWKDGDGQLLLGDGWGGTVCAGRG